MAQLTTAQRISLGMLACGFTAAGVLHFVNPEQFMKIMPPWIPWHRELVLVSGFFEIAGGVGLLLPPVRRAAGYGLTALLVAVFPANIEMAVHPQTAGLNLPVLLLWARLPLQFGLIWLVLWSTRTKRPTSTIPG